MKKEVNTMTMSFLDLLSGALGAVILLFVIVPKTSISEKEVLSQMKQLELDAVQIDSLLQELAESEETISIEEYLTVVDKVKTQLKKEKVLREKLTAQMAEGEKAIKDLQRNKHMLNVELAQARRDMQAQKTKNTALAASNAKSRNTKKATAQKVAQIEKQVTKVKKNDRPFFFGFEAPLCIVLNWDTASTDVDLFLEKEGSFCDGFNRTQSFGRWVRVPKKYLSKPTEVIIQKEIVPGTYKIHAHVSRPRKGGQANISGFVALDLGENKSQKINFKKQVMTSAPPPYHKKANGSTLIGELIVTETNIQFNAK